MRPFLLVICYLGLLTSCSREGKVQWSGFKTAADVQGALAKLTAQGESREEVLRLLQIKGVARNQIGMTDDLILCKVDGPRHSLGVSSVWLIQFHFDRSGLMNVEVSEGLIGP
jgi:hypothetical protein